MSILRAWITVPRILTVAIVVAVVVALVTILEDPSDSVEDGERVDGFVSGEGDDRREVGDLGFGEVRIETDVGRKVYRGGEEQGSKGSQRWVQVDWDPEETSGRPLIWPRATSAQLSGPASQLIMVAGGERYVLAEHLRVSDDRGSVTMRIPDAKGLRFVVRTGGKDRPVRPEPERGFDPGKQASCDDDAFSSGFSSRVACTVKAERARYVVGLGWAPAGQDWVVVEEARASSSGGDGDEPMVTRWEKEGESVDYTPSGKPQLTLAVSGAAKPKHTYGTATSQGAETRLPLRAYLVPSDEEVKVTLRYRVAAVPAPGEDRVAGAPSRTTVDQREVLRINRLG